jgi:hypothetical protein
MRLLSNHEFLSRRYNSSTSVRRLLKPEERRREGVGKGLRESSRQHSVGGGDDSIFHLEKERGNKTNER